MDRYLALAIALIFIFLSSCQEPNKNVGNERHKFNSDSLLQIIRNNKETYRSFLNKGQSDSAIACIQKIHELGKFCTGKDSLAAYYRSAMLNYAYELDKRKKYIQAEAILQEVLSKPELPWLNRFHYADASTILGNIYTRYGDYKKALLWLNQAEKIYRKEYDTIYFVKVINNEAIALQELNLHDSVIYLLKEAEKWDTPQTQSSFVTTTLLASSYLALDQQALAVSFINKAKSEMIFAADDYEKKSREASLSELNAEILSKQGQYSKAIELLKLSEKINEDQDSLFDNTRDAGKLFISLSNYYLQAGLLEPAAKYAQRALAAVVKVDKNSMLSTPDLSKLYTENTISEALDVKASILQSIYNQTPNPQYLTTAIQCYTLSFEVEKKLMQYFSYDESKLLMLNESRQRSQKAIALCYQLYQLTKDTKWAQKAFEFAEKNKAFVLLESVKRNLAANTALQNDTLYQKVQSLQLQLAYTERSLAETTGDSAKQKIQLQKNKLENDLLFANTALGRQSVAYKAIMEKEDSISASSVSEGLLNEHTGLIEFFNADSVTYAFVLNKKQPTQFIRYNANLSFAIDSMLYFFRSASAIGNQPLAYQKAAYDLYRILQFDQLEKGWQNLVIIPDGKLSFLPFDALITNTAFTINLQEANYFVNQCNTLYGFSAAILLKQLHNDRSTANSTTVFAPVFSNGQNHQQPLQYSLQEAEAIAANKNTTSFVKEKATLANFRQQLNNSGIMHIATHAYADTGANSNPKIEFIDSSLLLNELYAMHTNASLVVLSACETGLGKLNSSEGPMSLARGFYYAGAENVITSYWNVDDKSTAVLFSSVYKNMENNSSSDAIYQAKKQLIKTKNGKFASPYYWAGFVHIGMPHPKESRNYWWALLMIPLMIVVFYSLKPKTHPPTSTTRIP